MSAIVYQGIIYYIVTVEKNAVSTFKDMNTLEFSITLPANLYINWSNFHICLPIRIRESTNEANDIDANMITVNNFFAHWVK